MDLFSSTAIPVLENVVNFSQARHAVLASNIANMDVPGYRTRDLSPEKFEQRLKAAISARDERSEPSLGETPIRHGDPFKDVNKNMQSILMHDDSNVGLEQQVAAISKNQMQHNLALTIMNAQFRQLQTAISERA